MVVETPCTQHEEIIQDHARKIAELQTRAEYKEKLIDSLDDKMEKMDKKMDELLEGFNDFKIESTHDDTQLELRLKAIETQQVVLKEISDKNRADANMRLGIVALVFAILTFYFNFMR